MPNAITLVSLGISREEIIERIIAQLTDETVGGEWVGDLVDGGLKRECRQRIDTAISNIGKEQVTARIKELVESKAIQLTNQFGEAKGAPVTFTEYLVSRADSYMQEMVDSDGRDKTDRNFSNFSKQSRISWMINKYIGKQISDALAVATGEFNKEVAKSLTNTLNIQLKETIAKLAVEVTAK